MNKLYIYRFCSRNKDNANIKNFHKRQKILLDYDENEDKINHLFKQFVNDGVPGEMCRMYKSLNARDEHKIHKAFIIKLMTEEPPISKYERYLHSVAMKKENAAEKRWFFDFDIDNEELLNEFLNDVRNYIPEAFAKKTPHGYAVICNHGFDTREIMSKYANYDITLMRDDLLFIKSEITNTYD